jgi:hypothetical protein
MGYVALSDTYSETTALCLAQLDLDQGAEHVLTVKRTRYLAEIKRSKSLLLLPKTVLWKTTYRLQYRSQYNRVVRCAISHGSRCFSTRSEPIWCVVYQQQEQCEREEKGHLRMVRALDANHDFVSCRKRRSACGSSRLNARLGMVTMSVFCTGKGNNKYSAWRLKT